ncbi:hypothetical protein [Nocardia sp. CDC160]|uniref:hypothetical protein n=1 Tax=Nocardia sp. CDC160 TaxID=3112166 RepID=UPI002DB9D911|nr:hypothetical protein [Nocardia sp. CDC160]MEC3920351.1 hypothetical protein [Nocardia sp. CDC160]
MQIHTTHSRMVGYTVTAAPEQSGETYFEPQTQSETTRFMDCLLVKIVVQPGDIMLCEAASVVVDQVAAQTETTLIVIDGYGSQPAFPIAGHTHAANLSTDVGDILSDVADRLRARGRRVHRAPSGWPKSWDADPFEYHGAQRIIELAIGQEPTEWSAAHISGWSTRCGLLFRP